MSTNGILSESAPPAGLTLLMYPPEGKGPAYGNLFFVNRGDITDRIRIALVPNEQIPSPDYYIAYDTIVPPNHTVVLQQICLAEFEQLYVYSERGSTTFVYTGIEY
jgi:hypothetical protein